MQSVSGHDYYTAIASIHWGAWYYSNTQVLCGKSWANNMQEDCPGLIDRGRGTHSSTTTLHPLNETRTVGHLLPQLSPGKFLAQGKQQQQCQSVLSGNQTCNFRLAGWCRDHLAMLPHSAHTHMHTCTHTQHNPHTQHTHNTTHTHTHTHAHTLV